MLGNWKCISHGKMTFSHTKMQILHQSKYYFSHPNKKLRMLGYTSTGAEETKATEGRGKAARPGAKLGLRVGQHIRLRRPLYIRTHTHLYTFPVIEDSSIINRTGVCAHMGSTAAFTEVIISLVYHGFWLLMVKLIYLHELCSM